MTQIPPDVGPTAAPDVEHHGEATTSLVLQLREEQLRGILDAASEGIVTANASQVIVMANRAAAEIFRCRVEDLVGSPLDRLVPPRLRDFHRARVDDFGAAESAARRVGSSPDFIGLRADGEEFPMEAGISQAHVDGMRLFTVILRDLSEQRRSAAALRGSEELLAATFGASSVPMAHIDPHTHRFLVVNPALCQLTGYSGTELLAMCPDDLNHPDNPLDHEQFERLKLHGSGYDVEKRLLRKDGSVVHVRITGSVVYDADRRPLRVVGVLLDITALRLAEMALRARVARQDFLVRLNDRLRHLRDPQVIAFEAAHMLGQFTGAARVGYGEDDGNGETISVAGCFTSGVPGIEGRHRYLDYGEPLLHALRAGHTTINRDVAADPTLDAAQKQAYARLQLGATVGVPLLRDGRLQAVFFVQSRSARDWTADEVALFEEVAERVRADIERARAETQAHATRARLEAALESMNDAVFISDIDGQFTDFNEAFVSFHRFASRAECLRTLGEYPDILEVFKVDGSPAPLEQWAVPRALRGEIGSNVEYGLRRRDTGERWTGSYSFAPIRDAAGRITGAVITGRDITQVKRMRAELEASHAELQRLIAATDSVQERERLRIARELHDDMQQSLAALLMETMVVRAATELQPEHPAALALARIEAIAQRAIASTRRIIQDLRPQVLEELGLGPALQALADQFSQRTGAECTVDLAGLDGEDGTRLGSQGTCLYRVAQESLHNVARHARASSVRLTLARTPQHRLLLTVADDGVGMPIGGARQDAYGQIGMRERVRAAGGELRVRSTPWQGTTIEAELPWQPPLD